MVGNYCSVAGCKKDARVASEEGGGHFFRFPKDPERQKAWIASCNRPDKVSPHSARICSDHFRDEDFEDLIQARVLKTYPKKLKKDAVPSVNIDAPPKEIVRKRKRSKVMEKKSLTSLLSEVAAVAAAQDSECSSMEEEDEGSLERMETLEVKPTPSTEPVPQGCSSRLNELMRRLADLESENDKLVRESISQATDIKIFEKKYDKATEVIYSLMTRLEKTENFDEKVKRIFEGCFTPVQIDYVLKGEAHAKWTAEEMKRAFTLTFFSKECYNYLRDELKYPLPGPKTLRAWANNEKLEGILNED